MKGEQCDTALSAGLLGSEFTAAIAKLSGSKVTLCYQCHRCSSGCPISRFAMDDAPSKIIHAIRLGLKDMVLGSNTIWICASCKTCTARCPQGIDIAAVMDAARKISLREGFNPPEKDITIFYEEMLRMVKLTGRSFEPGLIGMLKLRTGNFTEDLGLGLTLLLKGKLPVLPHISSATPELNRLISRARKMEEGK
ncbi:MAG: 4Fe-4S dicluster domain-containing protein [Candidatus Eremiobacteraeota bacterium]|nr:4Fe-4S dicluster domain-containing protein [Candidatus Eremiobacteraeota bacterium]